MENLEKLIGDNIPLMDTINRVCFGCLGATTAWTANTVAIEKFSEIFNSSPFLASFLAVAISGIIILIFDFGLRKNFVSAIMMIAAKNWKKSKRGLKFIAIGFLFIGIVRMGLSTTATVISTFFIADELVEDQGTEGLEKMLSEKKETKEVLANTLSRQADKIRKDSEKRADELLSGAIESYGKRYAKLWRSGNSWVRTAKKNGKGETMHGLIAWRKGIEKATIEAEKIRAKAADQIASLQASQNKIIELESNDKAFIAITEIKQKQIEKAEVKEKIFQLSLFVADGLFSVMAILTSIGLAVGVKYKEDYTVFKTETSLLDIIKESSNAVRRLLFSYLAVGVGLIDKKASRTALALSDGTGEIDLEAETIYLTPKQSQNKKQKQKQKPEQKTDQTRNSLHNVLRNKVLRWEQKWGYVLNIEIRSDGEQNFVVETKSNGSHVDWTLKKAEKLRSTYKDRYEKAKVMGKEKSMQTNTRSIEKMDILIACILFEG